MEQQKFILMTDSAADLSAELVAQYDLAVIPLQMTINGKTYNNYPDEREIKNKDFYKMLREGGSPTTSAVNVGDFHHFMEGYLAQGLDILYLGFSSALSSTVEAAKIAAAELFEQFPGRTVRVVDTLCASLGEGMLVYLAAKKRQEGAGLDEVAEFAEAMKLSICHWFTVDDLFFLKRGGRVSAATALLGSALGIKPILHVDNLGRLINVSKVRGRKKSIEEIARHMKDGVRPEYAKLAFIVHGDCMEDAKALEAILRQNGVEEIYINFNGPVIGAHSGPGTLSVFYVGYER